MPASTLAEWAATGVFGSLALLIGLANLWWIVLAPRCRTAKQPPTSGIALIGGIFGTAACLLAPEESVRWMAWLPPLIEPGSLPLMAAIGLASLRERRQWKRALAENPPPDFPAVRRAVAGCLLGTAIGDALGLPGEGLSKRRLRRMFPDLTRYHFLRNYGMCSDDTEHAAMTAQAWLASRAAHPGHEVEIFAHSLARRLGAWLLGLPAGVGLATGRSIFKIWLGWPPDRSGVHSAGNGPAMRAAILGVLTADQPERLPAYVRAATRLTHTDPRAEQGALVIALAAQHALLPASLDPATLGTSLAAAVRPRARELADLIEAAASSVARGESTDRFAADIGCDKGVSGYMLHTVPVALHTWLSHPENLPAALVAAIRCGGDTDSVAAIVGGLVGARIGPEGMPAPLVDKLIEWPRSTGWLLQLAERIAEARTAPHYVPPLGLNVAGLLARNLLFLAVVLAHGFRRLLPPY